MNAKMIVSIALILLFASCCKEDSIPNTPKGTGTDSIIVLWKHYLNPDTSTSHTGKMLIDEEKIYYVNAFYKDWSLVQARLINNGELTWTYDNYLIGEDVGLNNIVLVNNQIIYNPEGYFFNINTIDGSLLLDNPEYKNGFNWSPHLTYFSDYIYAPYDEKGSNDNFSGLARRKIDNTSWEYLYTSYKGDQGYNQGLTSPSFYNTPDGDTILLFANRMWHFPKVKGRVDFIAYSLKNREVLWRVDSVDYNSSVIPPIVFEDKVYFLADRSIHCYNILSGNEIWRFRMPNQQEDVLQSPMIIQNGKLYIRGENHKTLRCLDAHNGTQLWTNIDGGNGVRIMHLFDNQIIFSSHFWLVSVDAMSGKTIWKHRAKDFGMKEDFNGWIPIGLNQTDSVIYVCDGREIAALKIPPRK